MIIFKLGNYKIEQLFKNGTEKRGRVKSKKM